MTGIQLLLRKEESRMISRNKKTVFDSDCVPNLFACAACFQTIRPGEAILVTGRGKIRAYGALNVVHLACGKI
jgi:hypothetical protein